MKITRAVVVAAVLAGVCGLGEVSGQTAKRPMTFQDLMAMKRVSDPQISPSGKWVMFSVTDVDLGKNTKVNHLWVVGLDGAGATAGSSASLRNDKQRGEGDAAGWERQITFGAWESFGRFSPDGKNVSLTMKDQIFEMPWDEAKGTVGKEVQVTNVEGGADGAVWSPDSKRLMFVASVWPECSVKGSNPTHDGEAVMNGAPVFVTGGTREVSAWKNAEPVGWAEEDACDKAKNAAADKSPVKGQVWDGLLYRHWEHWTGAQRSHVLVVDADGKNVRDLTPASAVGDAETPTFFVGGAQNYAWAPDSKEIAYVTNLDAVPAASTNNDVFTLRLDEPGAKVVKVSTSPGSDDEPEYSPDGKWLAFRSQARNGFESDKFRLVVMDRGTKAIRELMPKLDNWVDEFTWVPDSAAIIFTSGEEGKESIWSCDLLPKGAIVGIAMQGEYGDIHAWQGKVGSGDVQIIASKMMASAPAEVVTINAGMLGHTLYSIAEMDPRMMKAMGVKYVDPKVSGKLVEEEQVSPNGERQLTRLNQLLVSSLALAPLNYFWFTGAEGTKVQGFLMKPPNFDPAKKYPVKFLMHGGPQTAWGDAWSFRWNWELMAASGYVVVGINRRGSTGYGQKFVDEVSGDWGGRAYEDLMKGLDYVEAKYPFVDKTRECALGASYGGFMADWVLTHTNRFKCIVTHDGMYDPVSAYGTTEELWFNEWEFRRPEDFPKGWDGFGAAALKAGSSAALRNDKQKSKQQQGQRGELRGEQQQGQTGELRGEQQQVQTSELRGEQQQRQTSELRGEQQQGQTGELRGEHQQVQTSELRGEQQVRQMSGLQHGKPGQPWRYASLPADQDPFRKWAPVRFIQNAKTPTLVIHSQKDYRLDVSQGFELYTALQRLGVPSKMLYFPDESHWVLKPQDSQVWNEVVGDWCDRWTKTGKYAQK